MNVYNEQTSNTNNCSKQSTIVSINDHLRIMRNIPVMNGLFVEIGKFSPNVYLQKLNLNSKNFNINLFKLSEIIERNKLYINSIQKYRQIAYTQCDNEVNKINSSIDSIAKVADYAFVFGKFIPILFHEMNQIRNGGNMDLSNIVFALQMRIIICCSNFFLKCWVRSCKEDMFVLTYGFKYENTETNQEAINDLGKFIRQILFVEPFYADSMSLYNYYFSPRKYKSRINLVNE